MGNENLDKQIINTPKYEEYIVVFQKSDRLNSVRFRIANGEDDKKIISNFVLNNYGCRDFEIIAVENN